MVPEHADPVIEVYSRPGCSRCVEMKDLLRKRGIKFAERVLDFDIPSSDVAKRFPGVNALPILAVGKFALGGLPELEALIESNSIDYLLGFEA